MMLPAVAPRGEPSPSMPIDVAPPSVGWDALGPTIALTILATIFVCLRLFAKRFLIRRVYIDDYMLALAMLLSWAYAGIVIAEHITAPHPNSHPSNPVLIPALVLSNNTLYLLTTFLTKTTLLLQYLRLFPSSAPTTSLRLLRRTTQVLLYTALPLSTLASILSGILLCTPPSRLWTPSIAGSCGSPSAYWLSVAALNIGFEALVWALPVPVICSMHSLRRGEKVGLVGVFALGAVVVAMGLARLVVVHRSARRGDWNGSGREALLFSAVEVDVGLVCVGAVGVKAVGVWVLGKIGGWRGGVDRRTGSTGGGASTDVSSRGTKRSSSRKWSLSKKMRATLGSMSTTTEEMIEWVQDLEHGAGHGNGHGVSTWSGVSGTCGLCINSNVCVCRARDSLGPRPAELGGDDLHDIAVRREVSLEVTSREVFERGDTAAESNERVWAAAVTAWPAELYGRMI